MTTHILRTTTAAALLLTAAGAADTAAQYPTPEIHLIEEATAGNGTAAWIMRAQLHNTGHYLGLAITCDSAVEVTVFLGGFPAAHIPVQLAIRSAAGRAERFGPVVRHSGPLSGFHSPRLTDRQTVARFLDAALENGALVSNGYNSFWNRVPPARNREVRAAMRGCGR